MAAAAVTPPQALIAENLEVDAQELAQQRLAVVGASGSGKTYAVGRIIEQLSAGNIPVIVLDTVGVWPMLRLAANGRPPGLPFTIVGGDHQDVPLHWGKGAELARFLYEHRTSAVLDLSDGISAVRAPFVAAFCAQLLVLVKRRRRPLTVVFDEGPDLLPQTVRKGELAMLQNVSELIRKGRNHACGTIITSQRPQDVAKGPLDQAGTMLVGALYGNHERKALADWVGRKTRGSAVREQLDRLSELAPGQFFLWSPGWLKEYREIRVLSKWTYDGSSLSTRLEADAELGELTVADVADLRALLTEEQTPSEEKDMPAAAPKPAPSFQAEAESIAARLEARLDQVQREMKALAARYEALRRACDQREAALVSWRNSMPSGPLFLPPLVTAETEPVRERVRPDPAGLSKPVRLERHTEQVERLVSRALQSPKSEAAPVESDLSQRALGAIAVYGPLSFFEVALYARSSIKSGALVRALRTAIALGYVKHEGAMYSSTQVLLDRKQGPEWKRGVELRGAWEATLKGAQRTAWDALLTAPPAGSSQAELCTVAAVSQKSGAFVRGLRALKGWNLAEGGKRNWKIPEMTRRAFGLDRARGKGAV
jgi:hypothetical protein